MDEHDDDLESEVQEGAEMETDDYPVTAMSSMSRQPTAQTLTATT